MGKVLTGKPGGELSEMGTLKDLARRVRSRLIHLSLSAQCKLLELGLTSELVVKLTLDGKGWRVSAGVHQAAEQDGHIRNLTLLECRRILKWC